MSQKKWTKLFLLFSITCSLLVVSINYIVDPFDIFNSGFLKRPGEVNIRFTKINYLEKNHYKYNSYLFGSSRIGTTHPKTIEQYIPNSKFYNMTMASANLYDHLMHIRYMIKNKYELKNIYLQIDISNMQSYGRSPNDYNKKLHPHVTGDSKIEIYFQYLTRIFPKHIKKKIINNIYNKKRDNIDLRNTGIFTKSKQEKEILENCKKYVKNEKSFHKKRLRLRGIVYADKTRQAIREIKNLCKDNHINLYVFTTPHNKNMMDTYIIEDYLKFLTLIAGEVNYYDFSGYNSVTTNNCNYYEFSHYRPIVSKLIAARIFHDKSIKVPNDFGIYITKDNINNYIYKLRKKLKALNKY